MTQITIIGGGLAGLTAAIACAEEGADVLLHEAHRTLGGRARSTAAPYVANDGTHVLYSDGAPFRWLDRRGLAGPCRSLGLKEFRGFRVRYDSRLLARPPRPLVRALLKRGREAPVHESFESWGHRHLGEEATSAVAGLLGVVTYEADPGRLSAKFVWDRFRRVSRPGFPAPRYVVGGWGRMIERMAARARDLGVAIETGSRVTELPSGPVIVATGLDAARTLLGDPALTWESGRSALLDLGLRRDPADVFLISDLDEGGFLERYSSPDPTLAPENESLVQLQVPLRPGEGKTAGVARLERLADLGLPRWRDRVTWRRDALATGRTGALDLPGFTWRDRPAIDRGEGVRLAGDSVAAPGLLGEVAVNSGLEAARRTVESIGKTRQMT
ncbi:NAD(P)-binding protein [Herbidospora sp. NEAU-GS84]|uniref:NAD(P)-binding protein n=1 Tax=Herbidospora solisilvae TaxID=2696284 RepID=A0A7C9MYL5_9ACTN|nr:FAD-dependent oxidoreductase [Herbidospora solisilvae]NAS21230.1 NAD(P)-binding protein [Herbidospora solisilvae]